MEIDMLVCGMQRSGNHPIIHWIAENMTTHHVRHYNNIRGTKQQRQAAQILEYHTNGLPLCQIYSFENRHPQEVFGFGGNPKILIVRDIFNWLASWMASGRPINQGTMSIYHQYMIYAHKPLFPSVVINFGEWFCNPNYRQEIADKLSMPTVDKGLNDVLVIGGGSSFDKIEYDGKAQQMDILNRWKRMVTNPEYLQVLKNNADTVDLAIEYFQFNPIRTGSC